MIKFHDILAEIGVNKPNALKATIVSAIGGDDDIIDYIRIDDFMFWNGKIDSFPDYWCWWFSDDQLKRFKKWQYFKYFKFVKIEHEHTLYIIPKSQVQVEDNLEEIGINNPNWHNFTARVINIFDDCIDIQLFDEKNTYYGTIWTDTDPNNVMIQFDDFGLFQGDSSRKEIEYILHKLNIHHKSYTVDDSNANNGFIFITIPKNLVDIKND